MSEDPAAPTDQEREADFEMEFIPLTDDNEKEPEARQPAHGGLNGLSKEVPQLVYFDPAYLRRWKGRLFALKNNGTKRTATNFAGGTGRSSNYEEIYDADKVGEEAFPDAHVWKVCNDEAQLFDLERIEAWRDAVDVLLVFIGLFAAVVSAFLVETSKTLQPDYAQITAFIAFEVLRTMNTSVPINPSLSNVLDPKFGQAAPTHDNNVVNALWYTSLTISLSTALLAMLVKQWLHQYMTSTSGSARDRARIRHFRHMGLDKYKVPAIIDLLPTLLHIALALFLVGLALQLKSLHDIMFGLVVGIAAVPYLFYLISSLLPLFDAQCPYRSPQSFYVYRLFRLLSLLLWSIQSQFTTAFFGARRMCICWFPGLWKLLSPESLNVRKETGRPKNQMLPSLLEAEKESVRQNGVDLDVESIVNLCNVSENISVQSIALKAFAGLSKASPVDAGVAQTMLRSTFFSQQHFPWSVWAALARLAQRHLGDDLLVRSTLLSALHRWDHDWRHEAIPREKITDTGAVDLVQALKVPLVHSNVVEYLGIFDVKLRDVVSVSLSSITSLLSLENMSHLEKIAHDLQLLSPSSSPSTSPIPHFLSSILPPLFRSLETQYQGTFLGDEAIEMYGTILTLFFTSPHINHMSWETLASAMRMWYAPYSQSIQAITTPNIIRRALEEFHLREDPNEEDVEWVREASHHLFWIFDDCINTTTPELSEAVYSGIRELDMLPLDLESRDNTTSPLHLFWSVNTCERITAKMYTFSEEQCEERWFEEWLTYLHAPERFTFLCSKLVPFDRATLLDLCRIRPGDLGWPIVLKNLLSLFGNRVYLDTMVDWFGHKVQEPRLCLSHCLVGMKKILGEHHPILCKPEFNVPQFDDADNPIPSSSSINFITATPLLPESTSDVDHDVDSLGPSATPMPPTPGPSPMDVLSARDPSGGGNGLDPAPESTLPVEICSLDVSSSSSLSTAPLATLSDRRAPVATTSPIGGAYGLSEPPPDNPSTQQSPSNDTQHVSVNIHDASPSVARDALPLPRGSLDVGRQSVDSKAERGDLDGHVLGPGHVRNVG